MTTARTSSTARKQRAPFDCAVLLAAVTVGAGCVGNTGGAALDFPVAAAGPVTAPAERALTCAGNPAWTVDLTEASLHVGAVYLDQSQQVSGAQATGCVLTGTYVAEELSGLDVDLLSSAPQPFPARAHGITTPPALIGEVWLARGPIDAVPSSSPALPILTVVGTATQTATGATFSFTGTVTLEGNYQSSGGGDPICKKRIVSPIPAAVEIAATGGLLLRIDPCRFFTGTDFSALPAGTTPGTYRFSDDPTAADYAPTGANLYGNLHSNGPYSFSWTADL